LGFLCGVQAPVKRTCGCFVQYGDDKLYITAVQQQCSCSIWLEVQHTPPLDALDGEHVAARDGGVSSPVLASGQ
jgi:hypothetical protein